MQLYKPAQYRVDPESYDIMTPELIHYTDNELSPTIFYNYLIKNMPDYTQNIESIMQFEQFTDSLYNIDINKVLILSNKKTITEDFKAISSEYRDRLLFGFVPSTVQEVESFFGEAVVIKPEVIVFMSYDPETNATM